MKVPYLSIDIATRHTKFVYNVSLDINSIFRTVINLWHSPCNVRKGNLFWYWLYCQNVVKIIVWVFYIKHFYSGSCNRTFQFLHTLYEHCCRYWWNYWSSVVHVAFAKLVGAGKQVNHNPMHLFKYIRLAEVYFSMKERKNTRLQIEFISYNIEVQIHFWIRKYHRFENPASGLIRNVLSRTLFVGLLVFALSFLTSVSCLQNTSLPKTISKLPRSISDTWGI